MGKNIAEALGNFWLSRRMACSKLKFKGQLNGARAADLIKRAEPATGDAACPQARRQGSRGLTEQATAERVRRLAKAHLIEKIEGFSRKAV